MIDIIAELVVIIRNNKIEINVKNKLECNKGMIETFFNKKLTSINRKTTHSSVSNRKTTHSTFKIYTQIDKLYLNMARIA